MVESLSRARWPAHLSQWSVSMTTPWWLDPMLYPLYVLGSGSALLGLWLWVRPASANRWSVVGHLALALFALANAGYAVFAFSQHEISTIWLPPLLNAIAYLLLVALPSEGALSLAQGIRAALLHPQGRRAGAGLVLVGGMSVAAWLVVNQADPSQVLSANDLSDFESAAADLLKSEKVEPSPLCTDKGRVIAVSQVCKHQDSLSFLFEGQLAMLQRQGLFDQVIHLPLGWQNCNCHGYVFTAGHYYLSGDEVPLILEDNGYRETRHPKAGDVAVYRDATGKVIHTAVVRGATGEGIVLVESKWGSVGRFLHRSDIHCYTETASCLYYRSPRKGNQLRGIYTDPPISAPTDEMYENLQASSLRFGSPTMPAIETPEPRATLASED
jgi:hypothetical protein